MTRPTHLRAEHRADALGIGVAAPRLSWRLPAGARRQTGYAVDLGDGAVHPVASAENVLVPWPGAPLSSGEARTVRVRAATDLGPGTWSEPLHVEAGLLAPADWSAAYVAPDAEPGPAGRRAALLLRGRFAVDRPVRRARVHASAHGLYELWLDGARVGADELAPGYTDYATRTQVQTYDVTAALRPGRHVLGAVLADGWYRGQVGLIRAHDQWGTRTAFLAQVHLDHDDGTTTVLGTDGGWRWAPSPVLAADLVEGQHEDRRLADPQWCTAGRDDAGWEPVTVEARGYDGLVASPAPPVRAVEERRPAAVTRPRPGVFVVDLGQNVNGRVRLHDLGPAGTTTTLTHGEALGPDGDVTVEHLRPAMPFLPEPLGAGQVDSVVSAGTPGDVFDPRLTTHGFRYVRVEGRTGPLTPDDVTGVVVHTDLEPRGSFACSDDRLVRLHAAALWSLRGNVCDIPTDCPTRERAGWTGDWQVYAPTATYLYDVAGFSLKWLRDLAAAQWPDGTVANMAPMPPAEQTGFLAGLNGSAGWGDAVVLVPWELYLEYGDTEVLTELWPAMTAWLDRAARMAETARHPERAARRPDPAPHEKYLWDSGFHWGEWLEPGNAPGDFAAFVAADKADVATAYLARSAGLAARIARLLGRDDDARRLAGLAEGAVGAWRAEFLDPAGHVVPHTQANLVRALRFGLVPAHLQAQAADDLVALVRAAGDHLATGFLATPDLLPVLADHDRAGVAYDLLLQRTSPSWLGMLDRGATTVWEHWDGVDADGVPHDSLNHYSKGAVVSFLHGYVAGLRRSGPTWRRITVRPVPGGGVTWAATEHVTPHGPAAVSWRDGPSFEVTVTVPPGCVADVVLPDGTTHEAGPGTTTLACTR
ncbi:MAG: family 78 glycoside hydrolase catalytic domain [Actinobacteria bacterium]|nr:family 78 glycoside hydrolase catalytic domain [Actinomycetota bacterium]